MFYCFLYFPWWSCIVLSLALCTVYDSVILNKKICQDYLETGRHCTDQESPSLSYRSTFKYVCDRLSLFVISFLLWFPTESSGWRWSRFWTGHHGVMQSISTEGVRGHCSLLLTVPGLWVTSPQLGDIYRLAFLLFFFYSSKQKLSACLFLWPTSIIDVLSWVLVGGCLLYFLLTAVVWWTM